MNDVANRAVLDPIFGQITGDWPRICEVWEDFRVNHNYYLRAESTANRDEFLAQALWLAYGDGRLRALLIRLQEAGLTGPGISEAARSVLIGEFQLQSYVNGAFQPQDALIAGRRLVEACEHVCRISVDGKHSGTGILVRPNIVATAAHVIEHLIDPATGKALSDSGKRLSIHFFHADDMLADRTVAPAHPVEAILMQNWLCYMSPPATGDGGVLHPINSIAGITIGTGPWDFALIRLATPPRAGLRGYPLSDGEAPAVKFGIHVLHHPAQALGRPMGLLWSVGEVTTALGSPKPLRWLHDANTDAGSSGAPCFNMEWKIVALHQAGAGTINALNQNNRAVPLHGWAHQVDELIQRKDTTPYLKFAVDQSRVEVPVFGRRLLQQRAWHAMTTIASIEPGERVFAVLGGAGSGKTFTLSILSALAKSASCPLASIDVRNTANATAHDFALEILGVLGSAVPDSAQLLTKLTTELRDVRNEIVPTLRSTIEELAGQKPMVLVLDGLEVCDGAALGAAHVIEGLLDTLELTPHLVLALINWNCDARTDQIEDLELAPTVAEIVEHLLLVLAPPGFEPDRITRNTIEAFVSTQLALQTTGSQYERAKAVARTTKDIIATFLVSAAQAAGSPA